MNLEEMQAKLDRERELIYTAMQAELDKVISGSEEEVVIDLPKYPSFNTIRIMVYRHGAKHGVKLNIRRKNDEITVFRSK